MVFLCILDHASSWYLNKGRPTWCHLFYYVNLLLNMFQMLVHPSSGACDYLVCYCYITPTRLKPAQYSPCNNTPSSRKLLKMGVLTSETCWAVNWHNKISDIKLVYLYSKCCFHSYLPEDHGIYYRILTLRPSWPWPSPSITAAGSKLRSDGMSGVSVVALFVLAVLPPVLPWLLLLLLPGPEALPPTFPPSPELAGGTLGGPLLPPPGVWAPPGVCGVCGVWGVCGVCGIWEKKVEIRNSTHN